MNIVDAVKRLEKAGSESSEAINKLKEACCAVSEVIIKQCPVNVVLPRGYMVKPVGFISGPALCKGGSIIGAKGHKWTRHISPTVVTDLYATVEGQTREACLDFAKDVGAGLLDEITVFLEKRANEENDMSTSLRGIDLVAKG